MRLLWRWWWWTSRLTWVSSSWPTSNLRPLANTNATNVNMTVVK